MLLSRVYLIKNRACSAINSEIGTLGRFRRPKDFTKDNIGRFHHDGIAWKERLGGRTPSAEALPHTSRKAREKKNASRSVSLNRASAEEREDVAA